MKRGLVTVAAALALAAPAQAGGPTMRLGAAEDVVRQPDVVSAKAKLTLAQLAGFDSVRVTVIWAPGETAPSATEAAQLKVLAEAAQLTGIDVLLSVYHFGSRTTPLTEEARTQFASFTAAIARDHPFFREFIIGNEPNINRFWLPQFAEDGSNAAAPAYLRLLEQTYDALKAVSPGLVVWGGALSPRGSDNPALSRHTHSPTQFLLDMGAAYRASGRTLPVMDGLAIHPYGDSSSQAPRDSAHPNSRYIGLADYDKLVGILAQAFDGTAQRGSTLPILYDEFGVESVVPAPKASHYTGNEPATTRPVDEATQAAYYRQAVEMAFCQPNVRGLLLFHVADEPARPAWQSGVYYADGTPKTSIGDVRLAIAQAKRGVVARCEGLQLAPKAALRRVSATRGVAYTIRCDIDCRYRVSVLAGGKVVARQAGVAVGGITKRLGFAAPRTGVRAEALVRAALNPGPWRRIRAPG